MGNKVGNTRLIPKVISRPEDYGAVTAGQATSERPISVFDAYLVAHAEARSISNAVTNLTSD